MKIKKITYAIAVAGLASVAGSAWAQSAKFTAVYSDSAELIRSEACDETGLGDNYCSELNLGNTGEVVATRMATIKVPNDKELLVGLSAQVELFTETLVKGKKGTTSNALVMAEGGVELFACNDDDVCYRGEPGRVVLSRRIQELEATLGGVIESCTVAVQVDPDTGTGSGTFDLDDCVVEDESIRLALTTMAAHHFNFVFPNMPQGDYEVIARFSANSTAVTEVWCDEIHDYCEEADGGAGGSAYAVIGKYLMSVQQVHAVKDENGDPVIVEIPN
jgi:hypothetical protein